MDGVVSLSTHHPVPRSREAGQKSSRSTNLLDTIMLQVSPPVLLTCLLGLLFSQMGANAGDHCANRSLINSAQSPIPFIKNGLWGYRKASGEVVVDPRFQFAEDFSDYGLAAVFDNVSRNWQYIDVNGQQIINPLPMDNGPDRFAGGLARYKADGKIGYFDEWGCISIEARFDWAQPFSEGLAAVCSGCSTIKKGDHFEITGGRWGYIDPTGEIAIPMEYDRVSRFDGAQASAERKGERFFIDRSGNKLLKDQ